MKFWLRVENEEESLDLCEKPVGGLRFGVCQFANYDFKFSVIVTLNIKPTLTEFLVGDGRWF